MARERRIEVEEILAWSKKSTTDFVAHPITDAIASAMLGSVRCTELTLWDRSTNAEISFGFQQADEDEEGQWGTAVQLVTGAYKTSIDTTFSQNFTDLTSVLTKRLVRFVIMCKNTTGTAVEVARCGAQIDLREV